MCLRHSALSLSLSLSLSLFLSLSLSLSVCSVAQLRESSLFEVPRHFLATQPITTDGSVFAFDSVFAIFDSVALHFIPLDLWDASLGMIPRGMHFGCLFA